uniref:Uncharacterized protein n=1 Tax=Sciurus vulgaris TaxID=55149 RepID=A0A8D2DJI4_SCIVU
MAVSGWNSPIRPSTSIAASSQYRQLLSDYGPPSLGYTQGTGNSQVPQSKYAELLAIIKDLGKEISPTCAGSKSVMERLKRCTIHIGGLVGEYLTEATERQILASLSAGEGLSTV